MHATRHKPCRHPGLVCFGTPLSPSQLLMLCQTYSMHPWISLPSPETCTLPHCTYLHEPLITAPAPTCARAGTAKDDNSIHKWNYRLTQIERDLAG